MINTKKMLKNKEGFHPVIIGVVILAIVAMVLGIMVMTYSNISASVLPSTYESYPQTINQTNISGGTNQWVWTTVDYPIGSTDGVTANSFVIRYGSTELTLGTNYNLTLDNNTVQVNYAYKNKTLNLLYDSEQGGTTSFNKVDSNMYKGFDLGSIAPIVLAAGLIISVVIGFAAMTMGRRD